MQENLLQVCLLAMSLFLCPRDNPGLEELSDTTPTEEQRHQGSPQREVDNSGREKTHPDVILPPSDQRADTQEKNILPMPNAARGDEALFHEDGKHTDCEESGEKKLYPSGSPETDNGLKVIQDGQIEADLERDITPEGWNQHQGQLNPPKEENKATSSGKSDPLCSYHRTWTSAQEKPEEWHQDYTWYIWNTFSIISMIRLLRKCLGRVIMQLYQDSPRRPFPLACTAARAPLPNSDTLRLLDSTCIQPQVKRKIWEAAFLEGFANDLVNAMRELNDARGIALIEGYRMVDACDIVIPFRPSDFHSFQCELQCSNAGELANLYICAQIKVVEAPEVQSGCPCESSGDTVCLLHCETAKPRPNADVWGDLCTKNSAFLSKHKVTKLFQSSIKEAWERISHKYEFELSICRLDAPGAHVVRFRSGKKVSFTVTPVVQYNTDSHFFVGPFVPNHRDMVWPLSLTNYEDLFLKEISRDLPQQSCHTQTLQIGLFLHRKQCVLSGPGALKESHFKAALMHLLLAKEPIAWQPDSVAQRLRDLLEFMEKSLEKRSLPHPLVANPAVQKVLQLPPELADDGTVNLFHPLVVHDCIYRSSVVHFQELLKNANMLINDYVAQYGCCASVLNFDSIHHIAY